jgi:hypothetical protein
MFFNSYGSKTSTSSLKNHLTNHGIYDEAMNPKKSETIKKNLRQRQKQQNAPASR